VAVVAAADAGPAATRVPSRVTRTCPPTRFPPPMVYSGKGWGKNPGGHSQSLVIAQHRQEALDSPTDTGAVIQANVNAEIVLVQFAIVGGR
jgi:hypothetical protein